MKEDIRITLQGLRTKLQEIDQSTLEASDRDFLTRFSTLLERQIQGEEVSQELNFLYSNYSYRSASENLETLFKKQGLPNPCQPLSGDTLLYFQKVADFLVKHVKQLDSDVAQEGAAVVNLANEIKGWFAKEASVRQQQRQLQEQQVMLKNCEVALRIAQNIGKITGNKECEDFANVGMAGVSAASLASGGVHPVLAMALFMTQVISTLISNNSSSEWFMNQFKRLHEQLEDISVNVLIVREELRHLTRFVSVAFAELLTNLVYIEDQSITLLYQKLQDTQQMTSVGFNESTIRMIQASLASLQSLKHKYCDMKSINPKPKEIARDLFELNTQAFTFSISNCNNGLIHAEAVRDCSEKVASDRMARIFLADPAAIMGLYHSHTTRFVDDSKVNPNQIANPMIWNLAVKTFVKAISHLPEKIPAKHLRLYIEEVEQMHEVGTNIVALYQQLSNRDLLRKVLRTYSNLAKKCESFLRIELNKLLRDHSYLLDEFKVQSGKVRINYDGCCFVHPTFRQGCNNGFVIRDMELPEVFKLANKLNVGKISWTNGVDAAKTHRFTSEAFPYHPSGLFNILGGYWTGGLNRGYFLPIKFIFEDGGRAYSIAHAGWRLISSVGTNDRNFRNDMENPNSGQYLNCSFGDFLHAGEDCTYDIKRTFNGNSIEFNNDALNTVIRALQNKAQEKRSLLGDVLANSIIREDHDEFTTNLNNLETYRLILFRLLTMLGLRNEAEELDTFLVSKKSVMDSVQSVIQANLSDKTFCGKFNNDSLATRLILSSDVLGQLRIVSNRIAIVKPSFVERMPHFSNTSNLLITLDIIKARLSARLLASAYEDLPPKQPTFYELATELLTDGVIHMSTLSHKDLEKVRPLSVVIARKIKELSADKTLSEKEKKKRLYQLNLTHEAAQTDSVHDDNSRSDAATSTGSAAAKQGFFGKKSASSPNVVRLQKGWNCFDVAVGIGRQGLVNYALLYVDSKLHRRLLADEIRHAAAITVTIMNLKGNGNKETAIQRAKKLAELFQIQKALEQDDKWNQLIIGAEITVLVNKLISEKVTFPSNALPECMRTKELCDIFNNYEAAHENMREVVVNCNNAIGKTDGNRLSLSQLDEFFADDQNKTKYLQAYESFITNRNAIFTPQEQRLHEYCECKEIYEQYVRNYYGQEEWFAFQRGFAGERKSTSMIDIVAEMLEARIKIFQGERLIYQTEEYGNKVIEVSYNGYNHFEERRVYEINEQSQVNSK